MTSSGRDGARRLVDAYARAVAANLRGSGRTRRATTDEVRDHLVEAIESRGAGRDPIEMAEATIAGFGHPEDLARLLQPALDRRNSRVTALALLLIASGLTGLWFTIFVFGPPAPWSEPLEPQVLVWTDIVGSAAMKAALGAGFVAVLSGWLLPRVVRNFAIADRAHSCMAWSCRLGIGTLFVAVAAILTYAIGRGLLAPGSLEWSDVTLGATATGLAMMGLGWLEMAGSRTA